MKRLNAYIIGWIVLQMSFTACEQKELFLCPPTGNIPINVMIHWDSVPADKRILPRDMTVHFYPVSGNLLSSDMGVYGGQGWFGATLYNMMCMDFNGNSTLAFRSNGTREDFEAYNIRMTSSYNDFVPQLPDGEMTVAEAYPYYWYVDGHSQIIDTRGLGVRDTLIVHFYPENVLREFTFLIYDVTGANKIAKNSGAISGMSGSYWPATGNLATVPSTLLFSRVEAIPNGQSSSRWTDDQKALFEKKNPHWAESDTLKGWTHDWVVGKFSTFGPLDRKTHTFRLAVEAVSKANNYFHGAWGYWNGQGENTVISQIDSAMGKNGTEEEQLAWRQRNGGYDIILYNDHRLVIPDGEGNGGSSDGGFMVGVDDWGDIIDVPTSNTKLSKSSRLGKFTTPDATSLRSAINTYATIPDFVINGIWKENTNWNLLFNEQYVYKPESGLIWDYAPKKYWPDAGTVDFYAYAPAGVSNRNLRKGLHDNGNNTTAPVLEYTLSYIERDEPPHGTDEPVSLTVADQQEDLLVAAQHRSSPQTDPVPMNFHHAFSRITVKAKTAPETPANRRIKITHVDLRNLYISGKLPLNPDTGSGASNGIPMEAANSFQYDGAVKLWNSLDTLASYRFKLLAPAIPVEDEYTTLLRKDDGILLIPQAVQNNTVIYVEYDIYTISPTSGEQYNTSATQSYSLSSGFTFEIGRQYELLVTLGVP